MLKISLVHLSQSCSLNLLIVVQGRNVSASHKRKSQQALCNGDKGSIFISCLWGKKNISAKPVSLLPCCWWSWSRHHAWPARGGSTIRNKDAFEKSHSSRPCHHTRDRIATFNYGPVDQKNKPSPLKQQILTSDSASIS